MVGGRLRAVQSRIAAAAARTGRDPADVTMVVVTKGRDIAEIEQVYAAGIRDFGENRAQEMIAKAAALPADIRWHFVGHLQRNKVRRVRPLTTLLHSLDGDELAAQWLKGPGLPPPVLVQVNVGREPQKHGVIPEHAVAFVAQVRALGLDVRGLMTVPPRVDNAEDARPFFAELARIQTQVAAVDDTVEELSMGMTDDVEVAVEEGATLVRLGRAIFGPRRA